MSFLLATNELGEGNVFIRGSLSFCLSLGEEQVNKFEHIPVCYIGTSGPSHDHGLGPSPSPLLSPHRDAPAQFSDIFKLVQLDLTIQGSPWTCSNLFSWTSLYTDSPSRHVQSCSLALRDEREHCVLNWQCISLLQKEHIKWHTGQWSINWLRLNITATLSLR